MLREQASRSVSRRELEARFERFAEVSEAVGEIDEAKMSSALCEDPDDATEMLVAMARATDRSLRERARRLAAGLLLPAGRRGSPARPGGSSRLAPSASGGIDLDVDATLAALAESPAAPGSALRWLRWARPDTAYLLVVDASGSVAGRPLATALTVAAALASRVGVGDELGVVAFWSRSLLLRPVNSRSAPAGVIDSLLDLRCGDTTDLAGGLALALAEAEKARCARREVLALTDGLANAGGDPLQVAARASHAGARVHVLRVDDGEEATAACASLAAAGGGRAVALLRPRDAPGAILEALSG